MFDDDWLLRIISLAVRLTIAAAAFCAPALVIYFVAKTVLPTVATSFQMYAGSVVLFLVLLFVFKRMLK